ncbi:MAG: hypothetical protein ACXAB9_15805 [Candidatus Thorarchaeota archaeon]|jgi:hypothetical protein
MNRTAVFFILLQLPFEDSPIQSWFQTVELILNVLYALSVRGYLILVLVGFIIYASGVSDGLSKVLVAFGVVLYFVGPIILDLFAMTLETATSAWLALFGLTDTALLAILVTTGGIVAAVCFLVGAILYFTPTSNDLKSRGYSLMVRASILVPILTFFHVTPLL